MKKIISTVILAVLIIGPTIGAYQIATNEEMNEGYKAYALEFNKGKDCYNMCLEHMNI